MTAFDIDRAIDALARKQHGAFHHQQALEVGATPRMIRRRIDAGRWLVLDHHTYALPGAKPSWRRQAKAAELSVPSSALSGRAGGALFGLDGVRVGRLQVTAPRGARRSSALATVRHRDGLPVVHRDGIRVVALPQTIVDLAGPLDLGELERALDDALVRNLVTVVAMTAVAEAPRNSRAVDIRALRQLVADRAEDFAPPTSVLEAGLDRIFRNPLLPDSVAQAALPWWPEAPFRCDRFVPAWRRIIEVDGRSWHARYRDFERDKARDHLASMHGYEVTRFSFRQVMSAPNYVLGVLLAIGRHAQAA